MNKIQLVKEVASEGTELKRKIINAIAEDDPQSQVTMAAVTQLFADLNALVQSAPVKVFEEVSESANAKHVCPHCNTDLTAEGSVIRDYVNKSSDEDAGDVSAYGHYEGEDQIFESDSFEGFGGESFDLLDDSDKCNLCNGQL